MDEAEEENAGDNLKSGDRLYVLYFPWQERTRRLPAFADNCFPSHLMLAVSLPLYIALLFSFQVPTRSLLRSDG